MGWPPVGILTRHILTLEQYPAVIKITHIEITAMLLKQNILKLPYYDKPFVISNTENHLSNVLISISLEIPKVNVPQGPTDYKLHLNKHTYC